jgi:HEAT repeat protein
LAEWLKSENPMLRAAAAEHLDKFRDRQAIELLLGALGDKDASVRDMAAQSLRRVTGEGFGAEPSRWREWWEKNKDAFPKNP